MNTPRYLRYVQALALAATVPACTGATAPTTEPIASAPPTTEVVADAGPPADAPALDQVDSGYPHASGPIVPPELPAGFA